MPEFCLAFHGSVDIPSVKKAHYGTVDTYRNPVKPPFKKRKTAKNGDTG